MDEEILIKEKLAVSGELAWAVLAIGIFTYDMVAIKTRRMETMSNAVWKALAHKTKGPAYALAWSIVTFHLFADKNARKSYSQYRNNIQRKVREIV